MTKHKFLSDEWITAAQEIADSYVDDLPEPPFETVINVNVKDIPHRNAILEGHLDTSEKRPVVSQGHSDSAEATVTVGYDTARLVFLEPDPQALMAEFIAGKILVEGDVTKLLALQQNPAEPDPDAMALYKEIQEMTEV